MKVKVSNWPVEDGRYKIGNPQSPVAVCTEATVEGIEVDLGKVAIIGKCVTENIGIEKIVKNIISNPNIRYLILCGRRSYGHDVGQTIISLKENGIDQKRRVIGSTGSIPFLRHLEDQEIDFFRQQITPIDLQGILDENKINFAIEKCLKNDPGAFLGKKIKVKKLQKQIKIKCVQAKPNKKFFADPKGSFQIKIDRQNGLIICQHFNKNLELDVQINGKEAKSIYETACRLKLFGKFKDDKIHAAYLGKELTKAEIALLNNLDYRQDEPLLIKKEEEKLPNLAEDQFGW